MHPTLDKRLTCLIALQLCLFPLYAHAHGVQGDVSGGFIAGFTHPVSGLDHVVAMVAVGLWGAQLGRPAIWILPVTFPLVMALGGALGGMNVHLGGIESGIALSAIVLGGMVLLALKPPLWIAGTLVAVFAIFHGYAHGVELPKSANAFSYAAGFVLGTGGLHLVGILIGTINHWKFGTWLIRLSGLAVALVGAYFLQLSLAGQ